MMRLLLTIGIALNSFSILITYSFSHPSPQIKQNDQIIFPDQVLPTTTSNDGIIFTDRVFEIDPSTTPNDDIIFRDQVRRSNPIPDSLPADYDGCIQRCLTTREDNPICGSDGIVYANPGEIACAQKCGNLVFTVIDNSKCGY